MGMDLNLIVRSTKEEIELPRNYGLLSLFDKKLFSSLIDCGDLSEPTISLKRNRLKSKERDPYGSPLQFITPKEIGRITVDHLSDIFGGNMVAAKKWFRIFQRLVKFPEKEEIVLYWC